MSANKSSLHTMILPALLGSATCTGAALAQQTADDARTLDAISVTGSRISIPGVEASSPVASVERNEFLTTQPVAVESFLKELPAIAASIGTATNYGASGAATINMRHLGDNRTLVLIDGRRPIPFNLANVVDTNTIPLSLLQSVEVLTGGASVVYGADAVAGVTNFILRRDFAGVEFNMNWGQTKYHDGDRQNYEASFGALSDDGRANAVLSIGYSKVDPVIQGDRPWALFSVNSNTGENDGSLTAVPATVRFPGLGDLLGNPTSDTGQVNPATGTILPVFLPYNFNPPNYYQTGLDRWQTTALARYEFNEHAEAYGQVNYTRAQVHSRIAAAGVFIRTLNMPLANPYIQEPMRQQICQALDIASDNCTSGRNAEGDLIRVPLTVGRRMTELGGRLYDFDTKTFQATVGLRGEINHNWKYDGYWSYGESNQLHAGGNSGSYSKLEQAVDAISTAECLNPAGGCVPFNPFGKEGSITEDQLNFLRLTAFSTQLVEQTNAAFNLNGDLGGFKSPWADYPIGIAAGLEYRRTVGQVRSDAAFQNPAEMMGFGGIPNSDGGFSIQELYVESIIPIISGYKGIENLSLELGYRRSEFSNTGGFDDDYGSWKYGLTWSPTQSLKLRAMQQRATRAPNIAELFQPEREVSALAGTDPCAGSAINVNDVNDPGTLSWLCVQTGVPLSAVGRVEQPSAGQVTTRRFSNLTLTPEKADTTTLGLVWTPDDRFSLTLDYWNIEINDAITFPSVQDIFNACYDPAHNPGYTLNEMCLLASGRHTSSGTYNGVDARGITQQLSNVGFIQKTGIDLGVRFGHTLPGTLGRMQYALDVSRVTRDDFKALASAAARDCLGYYSNSCSLSHKLRSNFRATWTLRDLTTTLAWRHYGAIDVEPRAEDIRPYFPAYRHIGAHHYFDLGMSWNSPWLVTFNLSVNNLMDKHPPLIGSSIGPDWENSGNTYPQWYDALGRYYNLGISFRF